MNILVTGASGFIGSALVQKLRSADNLIICQSRYERPDQKGIKWIKHDLISRSWQSIEPYSIDVVYHLGGQTSAYSAKTYPINDIETNVIGLLNLIEHFRMRDLQPFIVHASTSTVVGLSEAEHLQESVPDHPVTFYDLSKYTAELYLKQYVQEGIVKGCSLRLSNVFGRVVLNQEADRGILDKVFNQAISGKIIKIYGDGGYLRDYIYINDVVSALIAAVEHSRNTNGKYFYVGSGKSIALKDAFIKVAEMAAKLTGIEIKYLHVPPPDNLSGIDFRSVTIDCSAFRDATGWAPNYDFDAGLEDAYG